MKKPNLSQSLLKEFVDYYDQNVNGCGLAIKKRYFDGIQTPSSDVQRLGAYFEYAATGYHHPNSPTPQPDYVYVGTPKQKLAIDYERAQKAALLYKDIIKKNNIEVTKIGEYMLFNECSGISDVRAIWNGEPCVIDIKYTSLFDDKWSEYGWHTESLVYKSKTLLQPIHYKYLIKNLEGIDDIPFYFFVFNSKDPEKAKIIKVNIQEEHLLLHEKKYVEKMKNYIKFFYDNPDKLEARPSFLRCKDCPFFNECDKRAETPLIEEIFY
jgi:hypothetical protein